MKLYYIWDAYCGWCYGFNSIFEPFMKNHQELDLEIISGGLFDQNKTIGEYPHIPGANAEIKNIYGVEYGEKYKKVLEDGNLILNSYYPAAGFAVLREMVDKKEISSLSKKLQEAFYLDGKSLGDVKTYVDLAMDFDLDIEDIREKIEDAFEVEDWSNEDFKKARDLHVMGFPTLLIEKNGKFYDLKSNAVTVEELEDNFRKITGSEN